jgi:hypothetical protein
MLEITQQLPRPVLRSIVRKARSRCIPGTNSLALVCRAWHDASSFEEDQEQLQLLLDLDNLSAADLATSWAWLHLHGSCVTGLSISSEAQPCWPAMEQLLSPAIMGNQLTRLELLGKDTLVPLAPHLPRLPCLQYLRASITAAAPEQHGNVSSVWALRASLREQPPDLGYLCPQLVNLHLTVNVERLTRPAPPAAPTAKDELSQLFPASLKELNLEGSMSGVDCGVLTHLTSLARLTISAQTITRIRHLKGHIMVTTGYPPNGTWITAAQHNWLIELSG